MWELLDKKYDGNTSSGVETITERMKVPKGWIVRTTILTGSSGFFSVNIDSKCSTVFVDDVSHEWDKE